MLMLPFLPLAFTGCVGGTAADSGAADSWEQSPDCDLLVSCAEAVDPDNAELYAKVYGEDGECWTGTATQALHCTQACQTGLASLAVQAPTESACWPNNKPSAATVFSVNNIWRFHEENGECYDLAATFVPSAKGPTFALSIVFTSGYGAAGIPCELDSLLDFSCDSVATEDGNLTLSGGLDNDLFGGHLWYEDDDSDCSFAGGPG